MKITDASLFNPNIRNDLVDYMKMNNFNDEIDTEEEDDDIPDYEDLDEEEILARQKEFYELSDDGKRMLNDIRGIQNSRIIKLESLVYNSIKVIKDSDDNIEDIEFSPEYIDFINWYYDEQTSGEFYNKYTENEEKFENILNQGLEDEDENNIFAYFKNMYIRKMRESTPDIEEPLSGQEVEAGKRFEKLSTTTKNLKSIFLNIQNLDVSTWEDFAKLL